MSRQMVKAIYSDEEKKEPEDRLIMQTGSLIKYLTEKKTEGIQAEKLAYIFHQKLADLIICGCRKIRKKKNVISWH